MPSRFERRRGGSSLARSFRTKYVHGVEVPVLERSYEEGTAHVYGTGTIELLLCDLPIVMRLPATLAGTKVSWVTPQPMRRDASMALRKILQEGKPSSPTGNGAQDAGTYPLILEHLTATKYPDGTDREVSALILVADATGWRGCLSDKDNGRSLWKTGRTVEELLLVLECALAEDDPTQWRQSYAAKKGGRKRS